MPNPSHVVADLFEDSRPLFAQGYSQSDVAARLGIHRSSAQALWRAYCMPRDVQRAFVAHKLTLSDLIVLERASREGVFAATWAKLRSGESVRGLYEYRTRPEIRDTIETTTDPIVRETLRWVLSERETLPVVRVD